MDCNVIQDLLPLYVDGCCSDESGKLVSAHLQSCDRCRRAYEMMGQHSDVQPVPGVKLQRISSWKASMLQSFMLFVSFAVITLGVILEGATPAGPSNGLWAVALIVPGTAYLLSQSNWYFVRAYKSRKLFSVCSCVITLVLIGAGYLWAAVHYAGAIVLTSPLALLSVALSLVFCVLSWVLSRQFACLMGKE